MKRAKCLLMVCLMVGMSIVCMVGVIFISKPVNPTLVYGDGLVVRIEDFKVKNGRYPEYIEFVEWLDEDSGGSFGYMPYDGSYTLGYGSAILGESVTYDTVRKCWQPPTWVDHYGMGTRRCELGH